VSISLRNKSGNDLMVSGKTIERDALVVVEGKLAAKKDCPEDAYLIGEGDDARLYPHALWASEGSTKDEPDVPAPSNEETA